MMHDDAHVGYVFIDGGWRCADYIFELCGSRHRVMQIRILYTDDDHISVTGSGPSIMARRVIFSPSFPEILLRHYSSRIPFSIGRPPVLEPSTTTLGHANDRQCLCRGGCEAEFGCELGLRWAYMCTSTRPSYSCILLAASITCLIYDHFLTFSDEVSLVLIKELIPAKRREWYL